MKRLTESRKVELTEKPKRKKTVYPTNEIAHLWMHQTQDEARNPQGNFYFNGDTIYSYGSHFPIARHVKGTGGRVAVLFTSRGYSSTTSGHIAAVRGAIPNEVERIKCLRPDSDTPSVIVRRLTESVKDNLRQLHAGFLKPKMHRNKRVLLFESIRDDVAEVHRVSDFFGLTVTLDAPVYPDGMDALRAEVREAQRVAEEKREAQRAVRSARQAECCAERDRINALKIEEKIELWRAGGNVDYWGLRGNPCMLRVSAGGMGGEVEVETSMGARFPLSHAVRVLRLYLAMRAGGRTYKRNGHTIHLGHYALDEVSADGTIKAGCHWVSADEVLRFAELDAVKVAMLASMKEETQIQQLEVSQDDTNN